MLRFLTMRVLGAIPLLFLLSIVTFAIIQAPPGDYGDTIRSMLMNQGGVPAEQAEAQAEIYREANGLNDPIIVQYMRWITGIVTRFDFGHSFFYNKESANGRLRVRSPIDAARQSTTPSPSSGMSSRTANARWPISVTRTSKALSTQAW